MIDVLAQNANSNKFPRKQLHTGGADAGKRPAARPHYRHGRNDRGFGHEAIFNENPSEE